jgi:hypothetical protein
MADQIAVQARAESGKRVAVVGAGGNIGSHLVMLVGRIPSVACICLIDHDVYEAKNLRSQNMLPQDVGKPKARVQARRLRQVDPALEVRAICAGVEQVPLGLLRADLVLAALDSRAARQYVNQACWRLGVPFVDGAVEPTELLARVSVHLPGPEAPCLECAWSDDDYDYALLEQHYPCGGESGPAPTNAPSSLGSLTAGLMAIECEKLLRGDHDRLLGNRQVMLSVGHHGHCVTRFGRNGHCRFDHATWDVEQLPGPPARFSQLTLKQEGHVFGRLVCPGCKHGLVDGRLALVERVAPRRRRCPKCGQAMAARGFDSLDSLTAADIAPGDRRRSLRSLGFRPGDIVTVRDSGGTIRHVQLGDPKQGAQR